MPPNKRRRLLGGAGLAGVLLGLFVLVRASSGDGGGDAAGIAPGTAQRATTTTAASRPPDGGGASVASAIPGAGDPFRQLVTVTEAQPVETGTPAPEAPANADAPTADGAEEGGSPLEGVTSSSSSDDRTTVPDPETGQADGDPPGPELRAAEPTSPGPVTTIPPGPTPPATALAPPTSTLTAPVVTALPVTSSAPPSTVPPATLPLSSTTTTTPGTTTISTTSSTTSTTGTSTSTTIARPGRIAFTSARDGNQEIYAIDPDGRNERRLTDHAGADREPAWSPDGTKLAFVSDRGGRPEIHVMDADGGPPVPVSRHPGSPASPTWAADGDRIAFESTDARGGNREIFLLGVKDGVSRRLTSGACATGPMRVCPDGEIAHRQPVFSPDGSRIAFIRSDRAGQRLFVMNSDGSAKRALGGTRSANPAWSADGRRIAYDDVDGIRVAEPTVGAHVAVPGTSRPCSNATPCPVFFEPNWSPDGTRLAVRDGSAGRAGGDLHVIDLAGKQETRLNPGLKASAPAWFSPRP